MADSPQYDVIVVGSGPGGYHAAIRAAQLGLKAAVVEKDETGGRCLNYACIPAKTLLRTAEIYAEARNGESIGIVATDISLDWTKLHERREEVRKGLTGGVAGLFKNHKIDLIEGEGKLTAEGNVTVGDQTYEAANVILATGSVALPIPGTEFGGRILDTWGAWSLPELPASLAHLIPGHSAILMANHGAVTYGDNLLDAFLKMETVEHFANICLVAHQLGSARPLQKLAIEDLLQAKERYVQNALQRMN